MDKSNPILSSADAHQFDVIIVGCGTAGLSLALRLPESLSICILGKENISQSSSYLAQGGIAAAISDQDSIESHINDTLKAGGNLCSYPVVKKVAEQGPEMIRWLQKMGIQFTLSGQNNKQDTLHLTQEGGHSHRRVVHCGDRTGKAIQNTLFEKVKNKKNITIIFNNLAVDLIITQSPSLQQRTCAGAYIFNKETGQVEIFASRITVLATGGAGKVYLYTSNPDSASGDGIAMAWRGGCQIANMEFIQFHPTCLYHPTAKSFLLSESLRGEGARLLLPDGSEFMHKTDPRGALAPRDIVARTIDHEMKRLGIDHILLDISHKSKDFIVEHFPFLYKQCLKFGYDMATQPIPVVPAVHYTCGGVVVDLEGKTNLSNLYAIGETACTGLHGANRMASNSLLECLVFAKLAGESIMRNIGNFPLIHDLPDWDESQVSKSDEAITIAHNWQELRHIMWNYVGIFRTVERLQRAQQRISLLRSEVTEYYRQFKVTNDLLELRNLVIIAELIVESALSRRESRGLHYMKDYPDLNPELDHVNTILSPDKTPPNTDSS